MDHIPAGSSQFQYPEVPHLYNDLYPYIYDNHSDIFHFPRRMGWDIDEFISGKYDSNGPNTPEKAASLIQAWLCYGLLHMITGISINTQDFIPTTSEHGRVITTRLLPHLLSQWRGSIATMTSKERQVTGDSLDSRFTALRPYMSLLCANNCLPQEVRYSMSILQSTLCPMKLAMFPSGAKIPETWLGDFEVDTTSRLLANGWCKSQVSRLFQQLSILTLYYASTLGPLRSTRDHSRCEAFGQCMSRSANPTEQEPLHVSSQCTCTKIDIPVGQLSDDIAHDRLPLLKSSINGKVKHFSIEIMKNKAFPRIHCYIAPLVRWVRRTNQEYYVRVPSSTYRSESKGPGPKGFQSSE